MQQILGRCQGLGVNVMLALKTIVCERCRSEAHLVTVHIRGKETTITKDGWEYVVIKCPKCGQREQAVRHAHEWSH